MTYAMRTLWRSGGFLFSHNIFTDLKHCKFCATFVPFCAACDDFWATPVMANNDIDGLVYNYRKTVENVLTWGAMPARYMLSLYDVVVCQSVRHTSVLYQIG